MCSSPCGDLDVVHDRVDGRERAQDLLDRQADLERRVALRVERLRRRHAAGHPEQDARIGRRLRMNEFLVGDQSRFIRDQRGGRAGSELGEKRSSVERFVMVISRRGPGMCMITVRYLTLQ